MIEFSDLDYKKNPYCCSNNINIYPLSDNGLKQYASKDCFPRTYIDKINPKLKKELDLEELLKETKKLKEEDNQKKGIFFNNELIGKK